MSVENDKIHNLENDPFLQYIFTELVKVHVALTGELPEFLSNFPEIREEDEVDEQ